MGMAVRGIGQTKAREFVQYETAESRHDRQHSLGSESSHPIKSSGSCGPVEWSKTRPCSCRCARTGPVPTRHGRRRRPQTHRALLGRPGGIWLPAHHSDLRRTRHRQPSKKRRRRPLLSSNATSTQVAHNQRPDRRSVLLTQPTAGIPICTAHSCRSLLARCRAWRWIAIALTAGALDRWRGHRGPSSCSWASPCVGEVPQPANPRGVEADVLWRCGIATGRALPSEYQHDYARTSVHNASVAESFMHAKG